MQNMPKIPFLKILQKYLLGLVGAHVLHKQEEETNAAIFMHPDTYLHLHARKSTKPALVQIVGEA